MKKIPAHRNIEKSEYILLYLCTIHQDPAIDDKIIKIEAIKMKNNVILSEFCEFNVEGELILLDNFYNWVNPQKNYIYIIAEDFLKILSFLEYYNNKKNRLVPRHLGYNINDLVELFEYGYNNGKKFNIIDINNCNVQKLYNICNYCLSYFKENKLEFNQDVYNKEFVIMDIETSGLDPLNGAEILRIVAYKIKNKEVVDTFCQLIRPKKKISNQVIKITGITNEMLQKGVSYEDAIGSYNKWCENLPIVTYNFKFDSKFFEYYKNKYAINFNQYNCYELITIIEKEYGYNRFKTKSIVRIIEKIDKTYYDHLDKNEFYYLNIILHILRNIYDIK